MGINFKLFEIETSIGLLRYAVREFIGRTLLCCCLRAYELFNLCWPRGGEINGTNEGRCIKFMISSSRNVHSY